MKTEKLNNKNLVIRIRQAVKITLPFLLFANASVQLWHNLDMSSRLHHLNIPLSAIEQVKQDSYLTQSYLGKPQDPPGN